MKASNPSENLELIVGLGNPGSKYKETRHNAGFWFLDNLAQKHNVTFKFEGRFAGELGKARISGRDILLLKPSTFMNLSGQSTSAVAKYFKINPDQMLVVHDELDLPPGSIRVKQGGGHGGHNGLRDITNHLGKTFWRLRIGIGHPGHKDAVVNYVLKYASRDDQHLIDDAIDAGLSQIEHLIDGEMSKVMQILHSR